ncbi:YhgE/Pip domain-containing protein [Paenibacillus sp. GCM10012306]|uniref:YhgE/Pip domain-containing protein n=1 Tax=Paenibacillus sp. GCM10012306 TaxID=3317342 RepID=UPI0036113751
MFTVALKLLKQPATIIGIITTLLFQVFFSLIWITGYDHVTTRTDQLPIAIVNEDGAAGQTIADSIAGSLHFRTETEITLPDAQNDLEHRRLRFIIHLPQGFTSQLSDPYATAKVNYILNESNPQMVSSVMQSVAAKVTESLNEHTRTTTLNGVLNSMKIPEAQAEIIRKSSGQRVSSDLQVVHPLRNFSSAMVPLMVVTASFTGAMFLTMSLSKASSTLTGTAGKWKTLSAHFIIIGATAIIGSLVGTSMMNGLGIHSGYGFITMWLFEFVVLLSCMTIANLSLLLLGDIGAWLNIALLSIQMLASGATVPRDMLSTFYQSIGLFSPAYYAVDGMFTLLIGGSDLSSDLWPLIYIGATAVAISILLTSIRREPATTPGNTQISA